MIRLCRWTPCPPNPQNLCYRGKFPLPLKGRVEAFILEGRYYEYSHSSSLTILPYLVMKLFFADFIAAVLIHISGQNSCDAGQGLSFKIFQHSPATGGNIAYFLGKPKLVYRGYRIAATYQ